MNLREIRILAGLTQKELAERSGVSQTMISAVERGEAQITLIKAKMITNVLGCSLEDLIDCKSTIRRAANG
jgi:transcriptional regulator with XRE-family HTH domain|nr:MAG TPA: Helix-turn-helix XRE-family like protein [Caudoviricetes sp.]